MKKMIQIWLAMALLWTANGWGYGKVSAESASVSNEKTAVSETVTANSVSRVTNATTKPVMTITEKIQGKPYLYWTKITGAEEYQIYRATSETGTYKKIAVTTSHAKTDTTVAANKVYYYKVRAVLSSGKTGSFSTPVPFVPAMSITKISNSYISAEEDGIRLAWEKVSGVSGYQIYRKGSNESSYSKLVSVSSSKDSYVDATPVKGRTYSYKIRAYRKNSSSSTTFGEFSAAVSMKRLTRIRLQPTTAYGCTMLTWDTVTGAKGYQVYRKTDAEASFTLARTVTGTTWSDLLAKPGTTYMYKVRAYYRNSDGKYYYGAFSDIQSIVAPPFSEPAITQQPQSLTVLEGDTAVISIKANYARSYQWYYRLPNTYEWIKITGSEGQSNTLTVKTTSEYNGYQYFCVVENPVVEVNSETAILTVKAVRYRALLVGEVHFDGETANRNKGDVLLLKDMLDNVRGPRGRKYTVTCKYDQTNTGLKNAISSAFSGATDTDVSLFFIATHGVVDVATGKTAGQLVTTDANGNEGRLNLGDLAGWLKAVPGKVIVLLGSCGSGAAIVQNGEVIYSSEDPDADLSVFNDLVIQAFMDADENLPLADGAAEPQTGEFRNSKFYVMTAAAHQEESWGYEGSDPYNIFPYYFAEGASGSGPADSNGNGIITMSEMYNYVYTNALSEASQHAQMYPANSNYELFKY